MPGNRPPYRLRCIASLAGGSRGRLHPQGSPRVCLNDRNLFDSSDHQEKGGGVVRGTRTHGSLWSAVTATKTDEHSWGP